MRKNISNIHSTNFGDGEGQRRRSGQYRRKQDCQEFMDQTVKKMKKDQLRERHIFTLFGAPVKFLGYDKNRLKIILDYLLNAIENFTFQDVYIARSQINIILRNRLKDHAIQHMNYGVHPDGDKKHNQACQNFIQDTIRRMRKDADQEPLMQTLFVDSRNDPNVQEDISRHISKIAGYFDDILMGLTVEDFYIIRSQLNQILLKVLSTHADKHRKTLDASYEDVTRV
jgi:hypothetical protein